MNSMALGFVTHCIHWYGNWQGSHGDLWDHKCVVSNSGEIDEVLEGLCVCESLYPMAQKSTRFHRDL